MLKKAALVCVLSATRFEIISINLVTTKAAAKLELLFIKQTTDVVILKVKLNCRFELIRWNSALKKM